MKKRQYKKQRDQWRELYHNIYAKWSAQYSTIMQKNRELEELKKQILVLEQEKKNLYASRDENCKHAGKRMAEMQAEINVKDMHVQVLERSLRDKEEQVAYTKSTRS